MYNLTSFTKKNMISSEPLVVLVTYSTPVFQFCIWKIKKNVKDSKSIVRYFLCYMLFWY